MRKLYSRRSVIVPALRFSVLLALFLLTGSSNFAQSGNALQYTGTGTNAGNGLPNNQYLTLPTGIVSGINGNFTIEAYVFWNGNSGAFERIFDFGSGTGTTMFFTPSASGANVARFAFISGATVEVLDASIEFPKNQWTHFAITIDGTNTGRIYIGGTLRGTNTITLRPGSLGSTTNNWLGRSQFVNDPYFNGRIDELRISNSVRYVSNFTPNNTQFTSDANTVALFHFNEGSGQQTTDVAASLVGILGFSTAVEPDLDPVWITNSILPVKIETFSAQRNNGGVDLKWSASVTGEGGNFTVERSSDGNKFSDIGTVTIEKQNGSFKYAFHDAAPGANKNFYRLRINEIGADTKWSNIVWVDISGKDVFTVNPSLTTGQLFISVPVSSEIRIYNNSGVLTKRFQLNASQEVSVSDLSKGVYVVRFDNGKTARFVKL